MQHFDQRPHRGSTDPYLIASLQGGYYVMCGTMVGCVVYEGYAFFIKKCTSTFDPLFFDRNDTGDRTWDSFYWYISLNCP